MLDPRMPPIQSIENCAKIYVYKTSMGPKMHDRKFLITRFTDITNT